MKIKTDLLPIGAVVKVKGYQNKALIISRDFVYKGKSFYDYVATLYPLGFYKRRVIYFQSSAIEKVYSKGYQTQRDLDFQKKVHDDVKDVTLEDFYKDYTKENYTWKERLLDCCRHLLGKR